LAALLAAATAGLGLEAYSRSRPFPALSKRSRAHDTPVRDHVVGGGPYGGHITSIAVARTEPATAFIALYSGGVYRSTDRGETWQPADRGLPASAWCELVADPVDGGTLYAACNDDGLFKTVDAGGLWRQLDVDNAVVPVISPADPRVLHVGGLRSSDGGRRWSSVTSPEGVPNCEGTLVADPRDMTALFCVTDDGSMSARGAGNEWAPVPSKARLRPEALLVDPRAPGRLLASTLDGAIYAITNHGATWTRLGEVPGAGTASLDDLRSDDSGTTIYGRHGEGLVGSADGGHTWRELAVAWPQFSFGTYAIDPRDPHVLYVGTRAGPYVSEDAGQTWQLRTRGLTRAPAAIVVHEGARSAILAAVGPDVFTSDDAGTTWTRLDDPAFSGAVDALSLAADGAGGVLLRAGTGLFRLKAGASAWADDGLTADAQGAVQPSGSSAGLRFVASATELQFTRDGGTTWQTGTLPGGVAPSGLAAVGNDPRHLVAAIGGLHALVRGERASFWRSLDSGATWTRTFAAADARVPTHCCALLPDPNDPHTLYAVLSGMVIGGGGAKVLRSADGGSTWVAVGFLDGAVTVVPTRPTTLLAQDHRRGVVRSTDGGATWTPSTAGVPDGVNVSRFAFDRRRPATIFAATDSRGVYRSADGGLSWTPTGHATRP
jgi:photosystem II stability/assembly factor-like uncharacterized protein